MFFNSATNIAIKSFIKIGLPSRQVNYKQNIVSLFGDDGCNRYGFKYGQSCRVYGKADVTTEYINAA